MTIQVVFSTQVPHLRWIPSIASASPAKLTSLSVILFDCVGLSIAVAIPGCLSVCLHSSALAILIIVPLHSLPLDLVPFCLSCGCTLARKLHFSFSILHAYTVSLACSGPSFSFFPLLETMPSCEILGRGHLLLRDCNIILHSFSVWKQFACNPPS